MAHVYDPSSHRVEFSKGADYYKRGWIRLTSQVLEPLIGTHADDQSCRAAIANTLRYWLWDGPSSTLSLMTPAQQSQADADADASALTRAKAQVHSRIDATTALTHQIWAIARKTPTQLDDDGTVEKAAVDAMTDLADVNAYKDPRIGGNF